jgi:hypothetical protein
MCALYPLKSNPKPSHPRIDFTRTPNPYTSEKLLPAFILSVTGNTWARVPYLFNPDPIGVEHVRSVQLRKELVSLEAEISPEDERVISV